MIAVGSQKHQLQQFRGARKGEWEVKPEAIGTREGQKQACRLRLGWDATNRGTGENQQLYPMGWWKS